MNSLPGGNLSPDRVLREEMEGRERTLGENPEVRARQSRLIYGGSWNRQRETTTPAPRVQPPDAPRPRIPWRPRNPSRGVYSSPYLTANRRNGMRQAEWYGRQLAPYGNMGVRQVPPSNLQFQRPQLLRWPLPVPMSTAYTEASSQTHLFGPRPHHNSRLENRGYGRVPLNTSSGSETYDTTARSFLVDDQPPLLPASRVPPVLTPTDTGGSGPSSETRIHTLNIRSRLQPGSSARSITVQFMPGYSGTFLSPTVARTSGYLLCPLPPNHAWHLPLATPIGTFTPESLVCELQIASDELEIPWTDIDSIVLPSAYAYAELVVGSRMMPRLFRNPPTLAPVGVGSPSYGLLDPHLGNGATFGAPLSSSVDPRGGLTPDGTNYHASLPENPHSNPYYVPYSQLNPGLWGFHPVLHAPAADLDSVRSNPSSETRSSFSGVSSVGSHHHPDPSILVGEDTGLNFGFGWPTPVWNPTLPDLHQLQPTIDRVIAEVASIDGDVGDGQIPDLLDLPLPSGQGSVPYPPDPGQPPDDLD